MDRECCSPWGQKELDMTEELNCTIGTVVGELCGWNMDLLSVQ